MKTTITGLLTRFASLSHRLTQPAAWASSGIGAVSHHPTNKRGDLMLYTLARRRLILAGFMLLIGASATGLFAQGMGTNPLPVQINPPVVTPPPIVVTPPAPLIPPFGARPPVGTMPPFATRPFVGSTPPAPLIPPFGTMPPFGTRPFIGSTPPAPLIPPMRPQPPVGIIPPFGTMPPPGATRP